MQVATGREGWPRRARVWSKMCFLWSKKLREFDIEEAAGLLADHGFKRMRTVVQMQDRFPKDIICSLLQR